MRTLILILLWYLFVNTSSPRELYFENLPEVVVRDTYLPATRLARIVQAEAEGEGKKGWKYVAQVYINRQKTGMNTDTDFDGYCNSRYSKKVNKEIYQVCKFLYSQKRPIHKYVYFYNPKISTDIQFMQWAQTKKGIMVGDHYFFK